MKGNLQCSLKALREARRVKNKLVPTFLEENLGFREVVRLRKNRVFSQQLGSER